MANISRILSSSSPTTSAVLPTQQSPQSNFNQTHSSTSTAENTLRSIFQGNYITGGVFNVSLAPTKSTVTSPELGPKLEKRRYVIESDSSGGSQEQNWC